MLDSVKQIAFEFVKFIAGLRGSIFVKYFPNDGWVLWKRRMELVACRLLHE